MSVRQSVVDHALDLMRLAGPVLAKRMFGGVGLFVDGRMFGLIDDDELFLKTDDLSKQRFMDAKCKVWVYPSPRGPMVTSYFQPPEQALEDAESMLPWAQLAIDTARRALAAKKTRPAKGASKRKKTATPVARKTTRRATSRKPSKTGPKRRPPVREKPTRRR